MTASPGTADSGGDEHFMRLALELAGRGLGHVEPNPMVGCVLVRHGVAIAQGFHRQFGGPHAEVEAVQSLDSITAARGATAYVSLEPCCHHGKTPPCSRVLIEAGIARVVVAMVDPFPRVSGGGLRELQQAGIETTVGVLAHQAEQLNAPYLKRLRSGKPWVIAKWAMTIDGRIATVTGQSQWITGPASRAEVHRLRSRVDAIAVGMGTVTADDPSLTARLEGGIPVPRLATRVVFCRHRLPSIESRLVQSARQVPLLLVAGPRIEPGQLDVLESRGAQCWRSPADDPVEMVQFALAAMGERPMTNLMVEGGSELLGSFLACGQIDECHVYIGAKAFGGSSARGPIAGLGVQRIGDAWPMRLVSIDPLGDDVRLVYRAGG
jgi:diaminohydroxyphosphoribosylaminopyrimidine deaminase/5-amino-6-(5-phosphoribosylamino)uracil reductase